MCQMRPDGWFSKIRSQLSLKLAIMLQKLSIMLFSSVQKSPIIFWEISIIPKVMLLILAKNASLKLY